MCLCPASLLHYELLPPPPAWLSAGVDRVLLLMLPLGVSGLLPVCVNNDGLLPPPVFGHAARLSGMELEEESDMLPSPDSSSCDGLNTVGGVLLPLHAVATGAGVADRDALTRDLSGHILLLFTGLPDSSGIGNISGICKHFLFLRWMCS